ncbi:hypothetical protein LEP1GSC016_4338 [Leptospira borgpetersenii serovar Hardjo-bovis str. Sponselee]|uniref:Uncharacterized protein n=1 Tax=Leptospira borgpetersenii serovar Hardjo-bovis str. Sponselee TaxID=1303729 RepID=M6C6Y0_LEPBO|nr:hypothetical protein LEP1GSC016_4338 [Leptospira borgpetersenii serovar Hardjo-bovis str. Sponselee]
MDELEAEIVSLRKEISTEQTIPESKEFSPTDSTPSETPLKKRNWGLF